MRIMLPRPSLVAVLAALIATAVPSTARADDTPTCPEHGAYSMTAGALTGPSKTDLTLAVTAAPGCAAVSVFKQIEVTFTANGEDVGRHFSARDAVDGVVAIELPRVDRGARIRTEAEVQTGAPRRETFGVRATATSLLRPDLVVREVQAPRSTLTTNPFVVTAVIEEVNGDVGATAHVTLAGTLGALTEPVGVTVAAGQRATVSFASLSLATPVTTQLKVDVAGAAPGEYDAENGARSVTVEVTHNELKPSALLVQSLGGYGFQFNGHLYAPITHPDPANLPDLESKVKAVEPQFVRVFLNETWDLNADPKNPHPEWQENLSSFTRVVELAGQSGATIAITYQNVAIAKTNPTIWMGRFADVLQDLVQNRHLDVRWANVGNEPNSTALTLPQYKALYVALDAALRARGLRNQIGLIGGDLVQNTEGTPGGHRAWFTFMVTQMSGLVDAWSEHIYWWYDRPYRLEERLKDVSHLVHDELPAEARKPTFLMEYGVRGYDTCGTKPLVKFAYYLDESCTEIRTMSLAGFHKLWFSIAAAQLGFDAVVNWDLYWSIYDRSVPPNQSFWTIGPESQGWPLYPSYYAERLLLQTTARGWQVLQVAPWTTDDAAARADGVDPVIVPDQAEQELTAYSGPDSQLTLLGLDTTGRSLVAPNGSSSSYSIGGLPVNTVFNLVEWNSNGDGLDSVAGTILTNAAGVARFEVPLQAAFALTTVPVS